MQLLCSFIPLNMPGNNCTQQATKTSHRWYFCCLRLRAALTVRFVADGASKLILTFRGFPEAVCVQVHTPSGGGLRRPSTEHGVTVVGPPVVLPTLNTRRHLTKQEA